MRPRTSHVNVDPSGPERSSTRSPSIARAAGARARPQAGALVDAGVERLGLFEGLEDAVATPVDALARVDHPDLEPVPEVDTDTSPVVDGRELGRVLEELLQDPAAARGSGWAGRASAQTRTRCRARPPRGRRRVTSALGQAGVHRRLEALHQPGQPGALDQPSSSSRFSARSPAQRLGHAEDHGDGRSELVAEPGDELVAAAARSSRASWAISSSRARRRSRSRASVSSSMTRGASRRQHAAAGRRPRGWR